MDTRKILHADNKGRILLGREYAGAFIGVSVSSNGLFLQRMQVIPMEANKKKKTSANILGYAGAWEKMSDSDLTSFLKEVRTRRKATSKRNKI